MQFKDKEMKELKNTFSMASTDVDQVRVLLQGMIHELSPKHPAPKKGGEQSNPSAVSTSQNSESVPLNAANLQQQQQQLIKMHQRSNSRSSRPPAAPTSTQPPFSFGASSPHGQPKIYGRPPTVTQDTLHIPARKKQKTNGTSVQGTPGSTSSPQISKVTSPEVKRQQAPEPKIASKPAWPCNDDVCESQNVGFENKEELDLHIQVEHVAPTEQPMKFVENCLRPVLGIDSLGQTDKSATKTTNAVTSSTETKMVATGSNQGQTPKIETATPSASVATPMNRQGSMAKGKAPPNNVTGTPKSQKDTNKQESKQPSQEVISDPWANTTIDPNELARAFQPIENGSGGPIPDLNTYRSITPNDTPESSKDGLSEPTSDISEGVNLEIELDFFDEKWNPFGRSDTEIFVDKTLPSYNANVGEDLTMFDGADFAAPPHIWDDTDGVVDLDQPFKFSVDDGYSFNFQ